MGNRASQSGWGYQDATGGIANNLGRLLESGTGSLPVLGTGAPEDFSQLQALASGLGAPGRAAAAGGGIDVGSVSGTGGPLYRSGGPARYGGTPMPAPSPAGTGSIPQLTGPTRYGDYGALPTSFDPGPGGGGQGALPAPPPTGLGGPAPPPPPGVTGYPTGYGPGAPQTTPYQISPGGPGYYVPQISAGGPVFPGQDPATLPYGGLYAGSGIDFSDPNAVDPLGNRVFAPRSTEPDPFNAPIYDPTAADFDPLAVRPPPTWWLGSSPEGFYPQAGQFGVDQTLLNPESLGQLADPRAWRGDIQMLDISGNQADAEGLSSFWQRLGVPYASSATAVPAPTFGPGGPGTNPTGLDFISWPDPASGISGGGAGIFDELQRNRLDQLLRSPEAWFGQPGDSWFPSVRAFDESTSGGPPDASQAWLDQFPFRPAYAWQPEQPGSLGGRNPLPAAEPFGGMSPDELNALAAQVAAGG